MSAKIDLGERTTTYALSGLKFYQQLPKSNEAQILGRQFLRAATSVGANYRETCRARSRAEFISTLGICLKELDESAYWLELVEKSGIAKGANLQTLRQEAEELISITVAIIKNTRANLRNNS